MFPNDQCPRSRLIVMSPLYPCDKPCSRGTHNETTKNLVLFSSIINGILIDSRLRISIPWEFFRFLNRIEILSHSRNLISTVGIAKFWPK